MFDHIGEILKIGLYHYQYDDNNSITYFKIKVSDDTGFRKNDDKTTNAILSIIVGYYYNAICLL